MSSHSTELAPICGICGHSGVLPGIGLRHGVRVLVCSHCTNAFTDPAPVANYDDHHFFEHAESSLAQWRIYSRQIIDFLARHDRSGGRLLDVGSSHGLLVEEANRRGFNAEGIEPSHTAVEHSRARGLNITNGYLTVDAFPPESFDVIVMSHVVEHVADPVRFISVAREILRPGGVLCVCQTNYQGTIPRWFGRRWDYWVEHEHYWHFSPLGIKHLMHRANLQVQTIDLLPLGYRPNICIGSPAAIRGTALRLVKYAITNFRLAAPYVGDQMYVLAVRG